jgi:uncharacterized membrane protein
MNRTALDRVLGTVIFVAVLATWLVGKRWNIDTTELMPFAVPVVSALFLVGPISKAAESASQAASQTNGMLDARIQAGVAKALAARDAARTRQAVGDVSDVVAQDDRPRVAQVAAAGADTEDYAEH